jgi:CelD/BcsL family acetyltransferase involved in cellulose biosynthesis
MSTAVQPAGGGVAITEHRGLAGLEQLAPAWQQLCLDAGTVPLAGPAWIGAHLLAFERAADLLLLSVHVEGRLAAVLPLLRGRVWIRGLPVRALRGPGNQNTIRFDLALRPGPRAEAVLEALWRHLAARRDWDCLMLPEAPAGGAAAALVAHAGAAGHPTAAWPSKQAYYIPIAAAAGGVAAGMEQTSRDFRAHLRWARRRLEDVGRLELECRLQPQPEELDQFFALEAAGWKGHAGHGNAVLRKGPRARRFFQELAAAAGAAGQFALHRLLCDGRLLAASLGLFHAQGYYLVKTAYDENYKRFSPGHLLTEALVGECARAGRPRFDFCGEAFAYEERWTRQQLPHAFLYVFRASFGGRLLHHVKAGGPGRWLGRARAGH